MSRKTNANRNRTLGAVGGAIALGGLSWYLYSAWSGSTSGDGGGGGGASSSTSASNRDVTTASGSSSSLFGTKKVSRKRARINDRQTHARTDKPQRKRGPPPTLSLSLPPTFVCTPTSIRLLEQLVALISQHYTVTIIVPSSSVRLRSGADEQRLAAVEYLATCLGQITTFDRRRIVEYEKEDGRFTLARALASDAHCEVMIEYTAEAKADDEDRADALFDDEFDDEIGSAAADDGDKTPRAASPVSRQVNGVTPGRLVRSDSQNHALNTALESYHAEMARIRKSSGLLLFLLLPLPIVKGRRSPPPTTKQSSTSNNMWTVDIESVLRPFLMPGQRDLSSRVPGVKVIDERLPVAAPVHTDGQRSALNRAWNEAAHRIGQLGQGWS